MIFNYKNFAIHNLNLCIAKSIHIIGTSGYTILQQTGIGRYSEEPGTKQKILNQCSVCQKPGRIISLVFEVESITFLNLRIANSCSATLLVISIIMHQCCSTSCAVAH